jgi:hypothetical protein
MKRPSLEIFGRELLALARAVMTRAADALRL